MGAIGGSRAPATFEPSRDTGRAMSQENVEVVRAQWEQFARGDFSAWADLPDDFEFVTSPEVPDAGTYRGAAAIEWMTAWVESFEGHTMRATEISDCGERVLVAFL